MGNFNKTSEMTAEQLEEKNRADLQSHADKVVALKAEYNDVKNKLDNMQATIVQAFAEKEASYIDREKELSDKLAKADKLSEEAQALKVSVDSQLADLNKQKQNFEEYCQEQHKDFLNIQGSLDRQRIDSDAREAAIKSLEEEAAHKTRENEIIKADLSKREMDLINNEADFKSRLGTLEGKITEIDFTKIIHGDEILKAREVQKKYDEANLLLAQEREDITAKKSYYDSEMKTIDEKRKQLSDDIIQVKLDRLDVEKKLDSLRVIEQRIKEENEKLESQRRSLGDLVS